MGRLPGIATSGSVKNMACGEMPNFGVFAAKMRPVSPPARKTLLGAILRVLGALLRPLGNAKPVVCDHGGASLR